MFISPLCDSGLPEECLSILNPLGANSTGNRLIEAGGLHGLFGSVQRIARAPTHERAKYLLCSLIHCGYKCFADSNISQG